MSLPAAAREAPTDEAQKGDRTAVYWLAAILLVGLGLRLFRLGAWEIGLDEAYSANAAARAIPDLLRFLAADDFHPPLHYLVLHYWRMLGTTEALLRLPSVVFGTLAIIVTYDLGRRLAGAKEGLVAALILALSPLHIYHAQEVRMYALLLLLATLSLWFAARLMLEDTHRKMWLGYVAATTLALYTHYGAVVVIVGQNIAIAVLHALRPRRFIGQWIGSQLAILTAFLPWLFAFLNHASRSDSSTILSSGVLSAIPKYGFVLSSFTSAYLPLETPALKATLAVVFAIVALGGAAALKQSPAAPILLVSSSFIALAIAAAAVGWMILLPGGTHVFIPRALLAASISYYVLIAAGIVRLRPHWIGAALIIAVISANLYSYPQLYYHVERSGPWREVASHVADGLRVGDSIVFVSGFWGRTFDFYFSARAKNAPFVEYHGINYIPDVERVVRDSRRVWLVLKQPHAVDPRGLVRSRINSMATLAAAREYPFSIRVELYRVGRPVGGQGQGRGDR